MRLFAPRTESLQGEALMEDVKSRLWKAAVVSNVCGAVDLFAFAGLLIYGSQHPYEWQKSTVVNSVAGAVYLATTLLIGRAWSRRMVASIEPWITGDRAPTAYERRAALRLALGQADVYATFWAIGAVALGLLNAFVNGPGVGAIVFVTILIGGVTTTSVGYLMAERILRPVVACALAENPPASPVGPGVLRRAITQWLGATGMPLLGIAAVAATALLGAHFDPDLLAASILFLAAVAIFVGLLATKLGAKTVSEPLGDMRKALVQIEEGDYDARVTVDDGSEIGMLEAGFNRMAAGLREREQLQDLFGRHVGEEVARAALDGGVKLGGETREVGVLFVDLVGSTAMAANLPPARVVALLNEFFEVVFGVVRAHGGMVNKFEGDGALCVFGAPVRLPDPAGSALAAARELRDTLMAELPEVDFGVTVSAGECVAGNVGAAERFEYTVIGDPVNEAARLCELAKQQPERVVASSVALERARGPESAAWTLGDETLLRGRDEPTRLATAPLDQRVALAD